MLVPQRVLVSLFAYGSSTYQKVLQSQEKMDEESIYVSTGAAAKVGMNKEVSLENLMKLSTDDSKNRDSCIGCIFSKGVFKKLEEPFGEEGGTLVLFKANNESDILNDQDLKTAMEFMMKRKLRLHLIYLSPAVAYPKININAFRVAKLARLTGGKVYVVSDVKETALELNKEIRMVYNVIVDIIQAGCSQVQIASVMEEYVQSEDVGRHETWDYIHHIVVDQSLAGFADHVVIRFYLYNPATGAEADKENKDFRVKYIKRPNGEELNFDSKGVNQLANVKYIHSAFIHGVQEMTLLIHDVQSKDVGLWIARWSSSRNLYARSTFVTVVAVRRQQGAPKNFPVLISSWNNYETTLDPTYKHRPIDPTNTSLPAYVLYIYVHKRAQPFVSAPVEVRMMNSYQRPQSSVYYPKDDGAGDPDITKNDGIYSMNFNVGELDDRGGYHFFTIWVNLTTTNIAKIGPPFSGSLPLQQGARFSCSSFVYPDKDYTSVGYPITRYESTVGIVFVKVFAKTARHLNVFPYRVMDLRITNVDADRSVIQMSWTEKWNTFKISPNPLVDSTMFYEIRQIQADSPSAVTPKNASTLKEVVKSWHVAKRIDVGTPLLEGQKPRSAALNLTKVYKPHKTNEILYLVVNALRKDLDGKSYTGEPSNPVYISVVQMQKLPTTPATIPSPGPSSSPSEPITASKSGGSTDGSPLEPTVSSDVSQGESPETDVPIPQETTPSEPPSATMSTSTASQSTDGSITEIKEPSLEVTAGAIQKPLVTPKPSSSDESVVTLIIASIVVALICLVAFLVYMLFSRKSLPDRRSLFRSATETWRSTRERFSKPATETGGQEGTGIASGKRFSTTSKLSTLIASSHARSPSEGASTVEKEPEPESSEENEPEASEENETEPETSEENEAEPETEV